MFVVPENRPTQPPVFSSPATAPPVHSPTPAEALQPTALDWGPQLEATAEPSEPSSLGANADVPVDLSALQPTPTAVEDVPVVESDDTSDWTGLDTDWGA